MRAYLLPAGRSAKGEPAARRRQPARVASPDKPSIAVLPFQNMSGDPEQDYFADGIVDDIVTGLSRIKWLFVIARNSSFVYKGKAVDVRQVGRELGVRYVLEGGVRKAGARATHHGAARRGRDRGASVGRQIRRRARGRVRICRIRSPTGWSASSSRAFAVPRSSAPAASAPRASTPTISFCAPYRTCSRACPTKRRIAIPLLEEALRLEPDYVAAHAHLAWCHEWCFTRGGFDEADRTVALAHARRAIASDADDAASLAVAGWVIIVLSKDHETALSAIERAISLNASCAMAHYYGALVNAFADRPKAVAFHANRALRLSPFDPKAFEAHLALGMAAIGEGRYDEAAVWFARGAQINPDHSLLAFFHAIALALAGRVAEAQAPVQRGLELEPGFRIRIFSEFGMASPLAEKFAKGARLLGLPE